jgi:hypothetical protein
MHGFGGENVNDNNGKSIHRYKYNIEMDFIHIDGYLAWIDTFSWFKRRCFHRDAQNS